MCSGLHINQSVLRGKYNVIQVQSSLKKFNKIISHIIDFVLIISLNTVSVPFVNEFIR
jgi:hypothetical protein